MENSEVQYFIISSEQLEILYRIAGQAAADRYHDEQDSYNRNLKDRKLHNTDLLLKNYRLFKANVENSVYSMKQIEKEQNDKEFLHLFYNRDTSDSVILQSVKSSKLKTYAMIQHIDKMLTYYKIHCEQSGKDDVIRRYNLIYDRYISDEIMSMDDIADKYFISVENAYRSLKKAKNELSSLIFGFDGVTI